MTDWNDLMMMENYDHNSIAAAPKSPRRRTTTVYQQQYRRSNYVDRAAVYPSDATADRYLVSTTILVKADKGDVELPLEASSVRRNEFGLPDTIFLDGGNRDGIATSIPRSAPSSEFSKFALSFAPSSTPSTVPSA